MITKDEIKVKLIEVGYIDNEYMDKYIDLMLLNLPTRKERGKTQMHHIIPVNTIKKEPDNELWGIELRRQRVKQARRTSNDSVNLLYKDHLLAHAYLTLCQDLDIVQKDYEAKADRRLAQTTVAGFASKANRTGWTWMHKNGISIQVDKNNTNSYLNNGWILGHGWKKS